MTILGEAFVKIGSIIDGFEDDLKRKLDPAMGRISLDMSTGLGSALEQVGGGLEDLRKPLLAVTAGGELMFDSYHRGFERIRADTGATGDELENLLQSTKNVASQVTVPFDEVAATLAQVFRRTGQTGEGLEDLTKQVIDLAEVVGFDATDNVDTFVRLITSWRIETDKQSAALDVLFRASQQTGTGVLQVADNALQGRQALQDLGFTFEQTVALAAKLGTTFPRVLSGIRIAMTNLAKSGATDLPAAFEAAVNAIEGAGSEAEAIRQASELFGSRAAPQMAAAIREGKLEFRDFADELSRGGDTIEQARKDTETFGDELVKLRNRLVGNFGSYAQTAANLGTIGLALGPVLSKVGSFISAARGLQAAAALGGESLGFMEAATSSLGGALAVGGGIIVGVTAAAIGVGKGLDFATSKLFGWKTAAENAADKTEVLRQAVEDHKITTEDAQHFVDAWNNSIGRVDAEGRINIDTVLGMSSAQQEYEDAIDGSTDATDENADSVEGLAEAQKRAAAASRAAAHFARDVADANREAAQSARDYREAQLSAAGGLLGIEGASQSATEAQRRLADARTAVSRLARQDRQGTVAYKDALEEFNSASLDAVGDQLSLAEAVAQYINENKNSAASTKTAIDLIQGFGDQAGLSAAEVDGLIDHVQSLIDKYRTIPETEDTEIEIRDEVALRKIDHLQKQLDKLRRPVEIPVSVAAGPGGAIPGVAPTAGAPLTYAQAVAAATASGGVFGGAGALLGREVIENHIILDSDEVSFQTKSRNVKRGGG